MLSKTAENFTNAEHRSFTWVLNHERLVKENGKIYRESIDYTGFQPTRDSLKRVNDLRGFDKKQIDSLADYIDMAYFIDTYGAYYEDWKHSFKNTPDRGMIYGGMETKDVSLMEAMLQRKKLIMAEFSIFGSPTPLEVRQRMERLLNIHFTGWIGRYFHELDTNLNAELPRWIPKKYQQMHNEPWPFKGSGICLFHEDGDMVILSKEFHLDHEVPIINTPEYIADFYEVDAYLRYPFWFEVCVGGDDYNSLSDYHIYANEKGRKLMKDHKIPEVFPAVIFRDDFRVVYYAGDFTDNPVSMSLSYFKHSEWLRVFWYNNRQNDDRRKFFWEFYQPFTTKILKHYIAEQNGENPLALPVPPKAEALPEYREQFRKIQDSVAVTDSIVPVDSANVRLDSNVIPADSNPKPRRVSSSPKSRL